jgi:hypothetical protein
MKQYRIKIKYVPRNVGDKYPWLWMVQDEEDISAFGNTSIMASNRERSAIRSKRRAERVARKLSSKAVKAVEFKNQSYLYPVESATRGLG